MFKQNSCSQRILISVLLMAVLLFEGVNAEIVNTNDEELFGMAITQLKQVKSKQNVSDAKQLLEGINSNYRQADMFKLYASAIIDIYDEKYDDAESKLTILKRNSEFMQLLVHYDLPDCDVISQYITARQYELKGMYIDALVLYFSMSSQSAAVMDSVDRSTELIPKVYDEALKQYNSGDYQYAEKLFNQIRGYRDSDSMADRAHVYALSSYEVMKFGHYEQDNNVDNGVEDIEWLILAKKDRYALLISKYGLEMRPYHAGWMEITWEDCSLRSWLNETFINTAFSDSEKAAILLTNVDNGPSQGYSKWAGSGGNNTKDKVFLLSYAEAYQYFGVTIEDSSNAKARMTPTIYALKKGAYKYAGHLDEEGNAAGWWWLRSPGSIQADAAFVYSDGSLSSDGVDRLSGCVRPAMWVNLNRIQQ